MRERLTCNLCLALCKSLVASNFSLWTKSVCLVSNMIVMLRRRWNRFAADQLKMAWMDEARMGLPQKGSMNDFSLKTFKWEKNYTMRTSAQTIVSEVSTICGRVVSNIHCKWISQGSIAHPSANCGDCWEIITKEVSPSWHPKANDILPILIKICSQAALTLSLARQNHLLPL